MEPQIAYCTSADGTRIAYSTFGESAGTPIVFVPWWGTDQEKWWAFPPTRKFNEELSRGRSWVSYDRRGVGGSQREIDDLSIETEVADLAAVVDHLNLERFDLMEWVGLVAAPYAVRYAERVRRLVLTAPYASGRDLGPFDDLIAVIRTSWPIARKSMSITAFPGGPSELQRWWSDVLRDSISPEMTIRYYEYLATVDISEYLPALQAQALVVALRGQRSPSASASRAVAMRIPDARFVPLEADCGLVYDDRREELLGLIRQFLGAGREPVATQLPSGTAIILFADIVDSTALTERLGDAAFRDKARELDGALRSVIRENGGTPVEGKLLGDGVLAVFTSARQAIEAALRCEKAGDDAGLPLHLGIHAGDVIREENNVYGGAVNIASRISGLSAPGEVLVSETVRSLARTSAGVAFEERGERELKGVGEPVRVWAVRKGPD